MTVRIEEVSQSTWRTIAALKVSESQHTFIEDNTTSLLEAAYDTSLHWVPCFVQRRNHCRLCNGRCL